MRVVPGWADAHIAALDTLQAAGRDLCTSGNLDMAAVVRLLRARGFRGKLPSLDLSGRIGTWLMQVASYTQPAAIGSYLRSHLGRVPRVDTSKSRRDLANAFRHPEESLADTLADLVRWGHIDPPGPASAR